MELKQVFPHYLAEVKLNYDNNKIVEDVMNLVSSSELTAGWDCDVLSTFNNAEINHSFAERHYDFLAEIESHGQEFLKTVGWSRPDEPEFLSHWWINAYQNEHWQEWHHHARHSVCAIYYATADAVPTVFMNPNDYTFHMHHALSNKDKFVKVYPEAGKLLLFPGYMFHSVPYKPERKVNYNQNRITMAFNFLPGVRQLDAFLPK